MGGGGECGRGWARGEREMGELEMYVGVCVCKVCIYGGDLD